MGKIKIHRLGRYEVRIKPGTGKVRLFFRRFTVRFIVMVGIGTSLFLILKHYFGHDMAMLSLPYWIERVAFEWLGDAAAESAVEV